MFARLEPLAAGWLCAAVHITSIDHLGMLALRLVLRLPSDNVHSLDSRGCRRGGVLDHRMTTLNSLQILLGMGWLLEAAMSRACCNHACHVAPTVVNGITRNVWLLKLKVGCACGSMCACVSAKLCHVCAGAPQCTVVVGFERR